MLSYFSINLIDFLQIDPTYKLPTTCGMILDSLNGSRQTAELSYIYNVLLLSKHLLQAENRLKYMVFKKEKIPLG